MIEPESLPSQGAEIPSEPEGDRRSFLSGPVVGGLVAGAAGLLLPATSFAAANKKVAVQAHKPIPKKPVITARRPVVAKAKPSRKSPHLPGEFVNDLYPNWGRNNFLEIQADENAHVAFIQNALGSQARPKPTFQGLVPANFAQFVQLSVTFENTGAGAYQGAAPYLSSTYLPAAASIGFVEAFHSGFLNTLADMTIVPPGGTPNNSFNRALTFDQVAAALMPFIVSLNDPDNLYPLPTLTDPSTITDVNILNFALIAEYLEQEFYNAAVPMFYV